MKKYIGYARVSTEDQELNLQIDALLKYCKPSDIFKDKISGVKNQRPGLEKCINVLQAGDTLIVWRLDRLGRSMSHLVSFVEDLRQKGIGFKSLCDGAIDTTSASGELIFNVFSALAQFEYRLVQERTKAGLAAARARGRTGGRKPIDTNDSRVIAAKTMAKNEKLSIEDICKNMKISRATYYRWLKL